MTARAGPAPEDAPDDASAGSAGPEPSAQAVSGPPGPPSRRFRGGAPADALAGRRAEGVDGDGPERHLRNVRGTPRQARPLAEWPERPRILVTNDDGIESRGLLALKSALEAIGDVYVMAPEANQSAMSHSMTFMRPLRIRERTLDDGTPGWSVDGSPTDAVSLAFLGYFGTSFDLVAAGINYGYNVGDDITYSGTVGAAMEAVLSGCPALAISQEWDGSPDFSLAGRVAAMVARNILEHGLDPGELLNVNVPTLPDRPDPRIELTRMGKRVYQDRLIERVDPRGVPYYWFGGPPPTGLAEPGTDFHAVTNGRVAITPIQLDLTGQRLLERIHDWEWRIER